VNISKKEALVYRVIQNNPGVQNNDADLIAAVWRAENWDDNDTLENNIAKVTRSETITRRRRQLHEKGLIKYSKEAMQEREEAFINERDNASDFGDIQWAH
jgi:hypothetical protein